MKTLITALALAALLAAPAFAHKATKFSRDTVVFAGKYRGQDAPGGDVSDPDDQPVDQGATLGFVVAATAGVSPYSRR